MPLILLGNRRGTSAGGTPVTTWPNGYARQWEIAIGKDWITANLTDFELLVSETHDDLRTTGNGGVVTSTAGWDIRFETATGTKLAHAVIRYAQATGQLVAVVKIPSLTLNTVGKIFMYAGKSVSAAEGDRANTFINWHDFWSPTSTGGFVFPNATTLTAVGTHTSGTDNGFKLASAMTGAQVYRADNYAKLNGVSEYAIFALANATNLATNKGILAIGPSTGFSTATNEDADANFSLFIRHDATGQSDLGTGRTNLWACAAGYSDGRYRVETKSSTQSTSYQSIIISKATSEAHKIAIDGLFTAQDKQSATARTGTLNTGTTSSLYLGAGSLDAAMGGWVGSLAAVGIRKSALSAAHAFALDGSWRNPAAFYSISESRALSTAVRRPMVPPKTTTVTQTTTVITNPVTDSYDPDAGTLSISSFTQPTNGTVVRNGNEFTYDPTNTFAGEDSYTVTLSDGTNTGTGRVTVRVTAVASTPPTDPPPSGSGPFADHAGPTVGTGNDKRPLFMRDWERDPDNTARWREPLSQRQFNPGTFVVDAGAGASDRFSPFTNYMGCRPAYHGSTISAYSTSDLTLRAVTWAQVCGGEPWTSSGFSDTCVTPGKNQPSLTHQNHAPWTATSQSLRPKSIGSYITTFPLGSSVAEARACAQGLRNNYYKAFALRLKRSWNDNGQPVIVLRPNHEGMNQNTGCQVGKDGFDNWNWFMAGLTLEEYNSMMRHFCNQVYEWFGTNIYIAFSPAFETTRNAPGGTKRDFVPSSYNYKYDDYFEDDNGVVGYNMACASVHPAEPRANTLLKAQSLVDGNGLADDGMRYWCDVGLNVAKTRKIIWGSLEASGFVKEGNSSCHGPTKFWGDTWIKLGERLNDPANYGTVAYIAMMNSYSFTENINSVCKISGHTTDNTKAGAANYRDGCLAHATGSNTWNSTNVSNWNRATRAMRKYWGKKSLYGNSTIPDRV